MAFGEGEGEGLRSPRPSFVPLLFLPLSPLKRSPPLLAAPDLSPLILTPFLLPSPSFPYLYSQQAAQLITALLTYNGTIGEDLATVLQFFLAILGIYLPLHKPLAKRLARFRANADADKPESELEL